MQDQTLLSLLLGSPPSKGSTPREGGVRTARLSDSHREAFSRFLRDVMAQEPTQKTPLPQKRSDTLALSPRRPSNPPIGEKVSLSEDLPSLSPNDPSIRSGKNATKEKGLSGEAVEKDDLLNRVPLLSARDCEAIQRIARLVEDGSLPPEAMADFSEEDWNEWIEWVLAGACGLFEPYPDPLGGIEETPKNENRGLDPVPKRVALLFQLQALMERLQDSSSESLTPLPHEKEEKSSAMLFEMIGFRKMSPAEQETLKQAFWNALQERGLSPTPSTLQSISRETLQALLLEVWQHSGKPTPLSETLPTLPETLVRALGIHLLDMKKEEGSPIELLQILDQAPWLKDRLQGNPTSTSAMPAMPSSETKKELDPQPESPEEAFLDLATNKDVPSLRNDSTPVPSPLPQDPNADGTPNSTNVSSVHPAHGTREDTSLPREIPIHREDVDPARMSQNIERLERLMRFSIRRGMSQISMELDPPELGRVTLRMQMRAGVMSAALQTETVEARHLLTTGVEQLRRNLAAHGIELESFDVSVGGQEKETDPRNAWAGSSHQERRENRETEPLGEVDRRGPFREGSIAPSQFGSPLDGAVDVII